MLILAGCRRPDWPTTYASATKEFRQGNSDVALALVEKLPASPQPGDLSWYWKFRILKSNVMLRRGDVRQAEALFSNSSPSGIPNDLLAKVKMASAFAFCEGGKNDEGVRALNDAQKLIPNTDRVGQGEFLYARGDCSSDPDKSIAYFTQAATLAHGADPYLEQRALTYKGYVLWQKGRCDQSIEASRSALGLTDFAILKAKLLGNIGLCNLELGEWIPAGDNLREAIAVAAQIHDAGTDRARWLITLGRQQRSQLQFQEAEKSYQEGFIAAKNAGHTELMAVALMDSAENAIIQKNVPLGRERLKAAEQLNLGGVDRLHLLLNKADLNVLEGDLANAELLCKEVLSSQPDIYSSWYAHNRIAEIYARQNHEKDAERMFKLAIAGVESSISNVPDRYKISSLENPYYDSYVAFLFSRGRTLDALSIAERGRSRTLASARLSRRLGTPLNLSAIKRSLARENEIVLAYWLTPEKSYLWLISKTQFRTFTLAPEMDIVREIEAYNRITQDQSENETQQSKDLYKMLVAPAAKYISKDARIVIVPHRRLHKLNFETLVTDEEKPHFWIDDVTLRTTSFLAALERPQTALPAYPRQLLLIGNPVQASKEFPVLAHASQEIAAVASRFKQSSESIYTQTQAIPEVYNASKPDQFRFLHFVTHGTASDQNPLESAIILSPGAKGFKLYAEEIIKTPIHPELVTISSCYGAGTRQYSGEGLVGLSWAFLRAGAHSVIGAMWETDDEANVKLMETFYGEMKKKDDPAAALRTAKLALLHSDSFWKRPFYWGALQLYSSN
jgi:CHAT domain-containing protein/Tfp pilus assembly protein PilF